MQPVNYLELHFKYLLTKEEEYLKKLEIQYGTLPAGKLTIRGKGAKLFFYWRKNNKDHGISKNKILIQELCDKKALEIELAMVNNNILLLQKAVLAATTFANALMSQYSTLTDLRVQELIKSGSLLETNPGARWAKAAYDCNNGWPADLKYKTPEGTVVRTKSEYFIALFLEKHNIPYRYEAKLELCGELFYPDFTLYKPDGSIVLWEHLGLYGDPNYDQRNIHKLTAYRAAGFVEHTNLICTYEGDIGVDDVLMNILNRYYYC